MSMRNMICATAMAALAATVAPTAEPPGTRTVVTLADGWRFRQDDKLSGAEAPDFADSDWQQVSVPHSWNRVGTYLPPVPNRLNTPDMVNKVQGVGWYRLNFTPPAIAFRDRRAWLEFDAASRIASVWLNGQLLGEHKGGYSRFRLDATRALRADGPNLLVVRTDNSKPAVGSSTADVLPLAGDFFVPGGLYRPVRLIATSPVHLDMLDFGGPGAYATTTEVSDTAAAIAVTVKLRNDGRSAQTVRMRAALVDAAGRVAAAAERSATLGADAGSTLDASLTVAQPRLWQGVADPYLYRLTVDVLDTEGRTLDRKEQPFGIRKMRFDAERGFFLNGKPYPLRGVGYHQDREDKGWAITEADVEEDVKLLREMGATSIRLTHYQHGQPIHDLADRYGLILWDEVPLVSAWTLGGAPVASEGLRANARQQLTELIRQNQNHASVGVWGIANEVDFGNSMPAFITGHTGPPPDPGPLLAELNALAKAVDPSRSTTLATCCEGRLFAPGVEVPVTAPAADLAGANRYFGWYYGAPGDLGRHLDDLRAKRPGQPLAVTEYGAGGSLSIHTDNVLGGPIDSRGRNQPEEAESHIHEANWAVLSTKPYLWGTWLWVAFDFASTVRREGDADDINTKGLVAYDHRTRKDAFYFYKANWTTTPTVHINGRRYVDRAYAVTDLRVYSNASATELVVGGKSLGTLTSCPQRVCVWRDVSLAEGENAILARGMFAGTPVEDRVAWRVSGAANTMRIDSGALVAPRSDAERFGSDNFFDGGETGSVVKPADYGKPARPVEIAGTENDAVAATYRVGTFRYSLPVPAGRYRVTLTFVEPSAAPGARSFDVLANGAVALHGFDPAAAGATAESAVERLFEANAAGGRIDLVFRPALGKAIVSAVQVEPLKR